MFSDKVKSYTVIDCRFSYEFQGGHISEAVNLPTTLDIELNLLSGDQNKLPTPSTSEALSSEGKNILIFHCEFSAKRAPTRFVVFPLDSSFLPREFVANVRLGLSSAKHLRSKDRLINGHDYPNIHYPEVYILQGGYAEYYKKYPVGLVPVLSLPIRTSIAHQSMKLESLYGRLSLYGRSRSQHKTIRQSSRLQTTNSTIR